MKHGKQETRKQATKWRGLVLICASQKWYTDDELAGLCGETQLMRVLQIVSPNWRNVVECGKAIAIGRLTDCRREAAFARIDEQRHAWEDNTFIKYNPSLYLHIYEGVTPIEPFPWKGLQGWKTLTAEEKSKIKIL
jgi:hypothetical protein